MANISSNNIITINRGDTFSFAFPVELGLGINKTKYSLHEDDSVYLGVMEANQPFEFAIIKKSFDVLDLNSHEEIVIRFNPEDTIELLPGNYYYSIKLVADGAVTTLIPKTKFVIIE